MTELVLRTARLANQGAKKTTSMLAELHALLPSWRVQNSEKKDRNPLVKLINAPEELGKILSWNTYSPMQLMNALIEAAKSQNLKSIELLAKAGADICGGNGILMRNAIQCGHFEVIKKLIELNFAKEKAVFSDLLDYSVRCERLDFARYFMSLGGRFNPEYINRIQKELKGSPVIMKYVALTDHILRQGESENALKAFDAFCGGKGAKIKKSDAFDKNKEWGSQNFVLSTFNTSYVASVLSGREGNFLHTLFKQLVLNDIERVENTKGYSWKKYLDMQAKQLKDLETFSDVVTEFTESLVVPSIALRAGNLSFAFVVEEYPYIKAAALLVLLQGKASLDFGGLNASWHRHGNQLPDKLKPFKSCGQWMRMLSGRLQIDEDYSIIELSSVDELKDEGIALNHCVGNGSYATQCLKGECHIFSIRKNGTPHATLEVVKTTDGELWDSGGGSWRVRQFHVASNYVPDGGARHAWAKFLDMVVTEKVKLSPIHGPAKANSTNAELLTDLEMLLGYDINRADEYLPLICGHYHERVHIEKNNGSFIPLIPSSDPVEMQEIIHQAYLQAKLLLDDEQDLIPKYVFIPQTPLTPFEEQIMDILNYAYVEPEEHNRAPVVAAVEPAIRAEDINLREEIDLLDILEQEGILPPVPEENNDLDNKKDGRIDGH